MKITAGLLRKIAKKHKFILLRTDDEQWEGFNTMSIFRGKNVQHSDKSVLYGFVGFKPCNIAEYITFKMTYKS